MLTESLSLSETGTAATPVATLFIHNSRSRYASVYGASGKKYEFRFNPKHNSLCREYFSPSQFAAEELDMRKTPVHQFVVCTLMGSTDVVTAAKESVIALGNADRQLQLPRQKAALYEVLELVNAAIVKAEGASSVQAENPEPAPEELPVPPEPPQPALLQSKNWTTAEGEPVQPAEPVGAEAGTLTKSLTPDAQEGNGIYTFSELMATDMEVLRNIVKKKELQADTRARKSMVRAILIIQNDPDPFPELA